MTNLCHWLCVFGLFEFHGQVASKVSQCNILLVTDLDFLKLSSSAHDLNETLQLGVVRQRLGEQLKGGASDVVIRGNHTQVQGDLVASLSMEIYDTNYLASPG